MTAFAGWAAIVLSSAVTAAFFLGRWAIRPPAVGGRDLGAGATLSFVVAAALYAALALTLLDGVLLLIGAARGRFSPLLALGFAIALVPVAFAAMVR